VKIMVHRRKKAMKLEEFLAKFSIEPTEIHPDLEADWYDYLAVHKRMGEKDIAKNYERWFMENRENIKDVMYGLPEAKGLVLE